MYYKLYGQNGKYRHIDTQAICNLISAITIKLPSNMVNDWVEYPDDETAMAAFGIELIPAADDTVTLDTSKKIDISTSHLMDVSQLADAVAQQQEYINTLENELRQAQQDLRTLRRQKSTGIKLGGGIKIMPIR
jgi:hypothetical protein